MLSILLIHQRISIESSPWPHPATVFLLVPSLALFPVVSITTSFPFSDYLSHIKHISRMFGIYYLTSFPFLISFPSLISVPHSKPFHLSIISVFLLPCVEQFFFFVFWMIMRSKFFFGFRTGFWPTKGGRLIQRSCVEACALTKRCSLENQTRYSLSTSLEGALCH